MFAEDFKEIKEDLENALENLDAYMLTYKEDSNYLNNVRMLILNACYTAEDNCE